jgi:Zn-dependent peptidase ImmA (M78 family)
LLKAKVHELAEAAASRLRFEPGDAMEPLVVRLGGRIEYKTADTTSTRLPESIIVRAFNNFVIFLPSVTSVVRDRFTIAHELGHLFLHYPLVAHRHAGATMIATRWVDETNENLKRAEWEANWFAAAFLMPSGAFSEFLHANNFSIHTAATKFAVSPKAAEVRARSLNIAAHA